MRDAIRVSFDVVERGRRTWPGDSASEYSADDSARSWVSKCGDGFGLDGKYICLQLVLGEFGGGERGKDVDKECSVQAVVHEM